MDLVVNPAQPEHLINVTYSASKASTWAREISALEAAAARFPAANRILVAHERTLRKAPPGIRVIDAWRHLLGQTAEETDPSGSTTREARKKKYVETLLSGT